FHHRVLFFHATHHHAEVFRINDDRYSVGTQCFHQGVRDLGCEILLDLKSARKNVHNARDFGQADYFSIGNVGDMSATDERQQMMFAHRVKLDVFHENDLARLRIENRAIDDVLDRLTVTLSEKFEG